jgi:hypothetical protein
VWPQTELFLYLKKRSAVVNITLEDIFESGKDRPEFKVRCLRIEQVRRGLGDHRSATEFSDYGAGQLGGQPGDNIAFETLMPKA